MVPEEAKTLDEIRRLAETRAINAQYKGMTADTEAEAAESEAKREEAETRKVLARQQREELSRGGGISEVVMGEIKGLRDQVAGLYGQVIEAKEANQRLEVDHLKQELTRMEGGLKEAMASARQSVQGQGQVTKGLAEQLQELEAIDTTLEKLANRLGWKRNGEERGGEQLAIKQLDFRHQERLREIEVTAERAMELKARELDLEEQRLGVEGKKAEAGLELVRQIPTLLGEFLGGRQGQPRVAGSVTAGQPSWASDPTVVGMPCDGCGTVFPILTTQTSAVCPTCGRKFHKESPAGEPVEPRVQAEAIMELEPEAAER